MSKYVTDIIEHMRTNPEKWRVVKDEQLCYNNGASLSDGLRSPQGGHWDSLHVDSIRRVFINNVQHHTTWWDALRLHLAMRRWRRRVSLEHLGLSSAY